MEFRHQNSDRISFLPQEIIEKILTIMPMRDAIRTSILSKTFRYCWTEMPKLVFDNKLVNISSGSSNKEVEKYKFVNAIFHVLLLHKGPISELKISTLGTNVVTEVVNEIDLIILLLSRRKIIKSFTFEFVGYKLPSSFFGLQGLEHLDLAYCKIELPSTFNGFSMLKRLMLEDVTITANMLLQFLANCPLLVEFTFVGRDDQIDFSGGNKCTFVELFKCLPSVWYVAMSRCYVKRFAAGGIPQKLPTSLVYLEMLALDVCFLKQDEVSSVHSVIRSSPNLGIFELKMFPNDEQTINNVPNLQGYSGLKLDHLKQLEITSFHNYAPEIEFVKLIMANAPVLEKARIELDASVSVDEENKMLRDLLLLPFPRASPVAKFRIERPV